MPRQISDPEDPRRFRLIRGVIIAVALSALGLALLGSPFLSRFFLPTDFAPPPNTAGTNTLTAFQPSITPLQDASATPLPTHTPAPINSGGSASLGGLLIVSVSEFGYAQLFSFDSAAEPTRLTSGVWDDIHPALNPDGTRVAFASNRGGQWDLFVLDLQTGETSQLSDDEAYDGHPSWSSDGSWLAYEHYEDDNLEIYFRPVDNSLDPVLVSANAGVDHSPAWRPGTQQIAFVSDRGGQPEIWLVDLEQNDAARFRLLVPAAGATLSSPAWSPDGAQLAWSANDGLVPQIVTRRASDLESTRALGAGLEPRWNPAGDAVLATFSSTNATYLTAYTLDGGLALAPTQLAGRFEGAAWGNGAMADPLPDVIAAAANEPNPAWAAALDADVQASSAGTAELQDVNAPVAELNAAIIAPFDALRQRSAELLGWDALSNLENAFVPLNEPLPPGRQQSWLYTGRAFALHSGLLDAAWLVVLPEEFGGQTYWRIYLRTAATDGLGRPLTEHPWDFAARLNGDNASLQAGGAPAAAIPAGTWIDFTDLAAEYGFERLPALPNWRSYYPGALFNEFAFTAGLSWQQAMLQLYSESAVATAAAGGAE